ncbi:MAG: aspartate-semialdehyde dehydrogenase [Rhodospirillales bacterium]|jgi:aspartate-semialdehyde dehydrogenase
MGYRIAVAGATGNVGREILQVLEERRFPADDVVALASDRSVGGEVSFGEHDLRVQGLDDFDFAGCDIVLSAMTADAARAHMPRAATAGAAVIDNSDAFRMEPDVPLVVPEVNGATLARFARRRIVASPSASAAICATVLKPLHDIASLTRAVVSSFEAVSGGGRPAMDELFAQTRGVYVNQPIEREEFPKQIAFNLIPHVDAFMPDGFTRAEWRIAVETRKLLGPDVKVVATCVQAPVFVGNACCVFAEFARDIDEATARRAWRAWRDGDVVGLVDHRADEGYVTPVEVVGEDKVYVSRVRKDPSVAHGLAFWCVGDNLRKGAALNMVQIAEALIAGPLARG